MPFRKAVYTENMADTDAVMAPATAAEDAAMDVSESATVTGTTNVNE